MRRKAPVKKELPEMNQQNKSNTSKSSLVESRQEQVDRQRKGTLISDAVGALPSCPGRTRACLRCAARSPYYCQDAAQAAGGKARGSTTVAAPTFRRARAGGGGGRERRGIGPCGTFHLSSQVHHIQM